MATPKPGEIRCPTCHRSTPPAVFCTQCGSAIPSDARIRPRGMDRDELQDRIRARRAGDDPYRRGNVAGDGYTGYERFEPDPTDRGARHQQRPDERRTDAFEDRATSAVPVPSTDPRSESLVPPIDERPDITRDTDDWAARTDDEPVPAPAWVSTAPPPADRPDAADEGYAASKRYDDAAYDDDAYAYGYEEWDDGRNRRSGAGAFAVLGLLALAVLALGGGALVANVLFGNTGTAVTNPTLTPSPTISQSVLPSLEPSAAPSVQATAAPTASADASGEPIEFLDGFTAEAQPCIPGSAGNDGCDSNATRNSGNVWVWVGFQNGTQDDIIGAAVTRPDGSPGGDGFIPLEQIGCRPACAAGWTYFPFGNLAPGTYEVTVERNGQLAAETEFTVE